MSKKMNCADWNIASNKFKSKKASNLLLLVVIAKRDRVGETEQEPKGGFFIFLINILIMSNSGSLFHILPTPIQVK